MAKFQSFPPLKSILETMSPLSGPRAFEPMKSLTNPKPSPQPRRFREEVKAFSFKGPEEVDPKDVELLPDRTEFDRFMEGEWVQWESSNCIGGRYFKESNYLELEFKDTTFYGYYNVGPEEAAGMFGAGSHGGWVWDNLRIRGTKLGYRKEYIWLSAISGVQRKWDESPLKAAAHGQEADRQARNALMDEAVFGRPGPGESMPISLRGKFR